MIHFMGRKGPTWPVTDEWKAAVMARMRELGIRQTDLANELDCTNSSLSALFHTGTKQSRLVPLIHKMLKWPPPAPISTSPDVMEIVSLISRMDDEFKERLRDQAELYVRMTKRAKGT